MAQFSLDDLLPTYDKGYMAVAQQYEDTIEAERIQHVNRIVSGCLHIKPEIKFNRTEYKAATGIRFRVIDGGIK